MRLHPATQILIWGMLVAVMQFLPRFSLMIATALVLVSAFVLSRHKLVQLLRRTRWILLTLWLIYAYSTPGLPLADWMGIFSPSLEGLGDGGLQLMRLLAALAGLAILLDRLHQKCLIAGLYSLFALLQWLGVSRERLAVRLALTLHYAEAAMLRKQSWQDSLRSLTLENRKPEAGNITMELSVYPFPRLDALLLTAMVLLLGVVLI